VFGVLGVFGGVVPYEQVYNNESKQLGEQFQRYLNQGLLSVTDGGEIDYRNILDDVIQSHLETPSTAIPVDPHGATNLSHHLLDEGLSPITITQNFTNMSDPMFELEAAINTGRFHHDGNAIMAWQISNVIGKYYKGNDDRVMPAKQKRINKIDGAVALIMAIGEAMLQMRTPNEQESIYESGEVGC